MLYHFHTHLIQILMRPQKLWFSTDVVGRLIGEGKQLFALKFVFEFQLADEYPPVPLLQAYLMDSQKLSQKGRKSGKSSRQSLVILPICSSFPLCHKGSHLTLMSIKVDLGCNHKVSVFMIYVKEIFSYMCSIIGK